MLLSKAHLYDEADQMLSFYAGGINYPTRAVILKTLRDFGPKTVLELAEGHPIRLSSFSQHLEILRKKSLIEVFPKYPYLVYSLNYDRYEEAKKCLIDFFE
jgi:DNA-binding transcriptional ArsR family regulator